MSGPSIADYDWLLVFIGDCTGNCETDDGDCDCCTPEIHAPHPSSAEAWADWDGDMVDGPAVCGVGLRATIPGVGSRLSRDRCAECCRLTSLPAGTGSPKNDQNCRDILGMD